MNTVYKELTDQKVTLHQGSPNIAKSNAFHNPWINVEPRGLNDEHLLSRRYKYAESMPGVTQAKNSMIFYRLEDTALPTGLIHKRGHLDVQTRQTS
jgi:hypothetical protein